MSQFELTEWLPYSPKTVFDFVTDPANAPQVIANVVKMEQITPGDVGVGTKYRETRRINNKEETAEMTISAYDPPHLYAMTAVTSGIDVTYRYRLTPKDNGTQVHLLGTVSASGIKKLMTPLVTAIMKRQDGDHLQRLKAAMAETAVG